MRNFETKAYGVVRLNMQTIKKLYPLSWMFLTDNTFSGNNISGNYIIVSCHNIFRSTFIRQLSRILNWQRDKKMVALIFDGCNSAKTNVDQKVTDGILNFTL